MTSLTKEQVEIILDEAEHAAYEAAGICTEIILTVKTVACADLLG